jgi:hypothetical protein
MGWDGVIRENVGVNVAQALVFVWAAGGFGCVLGYEAGVDDAAVTLESEVSFYFPCSTLFPCREVPPSHVSSLLEKTHF